MLFRFPVHGRGREAKSDGGKEQSISCQDSEAVTIAVKGTGTFDLVVATSSNMVVHTKVERVST